jgi:hypothetical protein
LIGQTFLRLKNNKEFKDISSKAYDAMVVKGRHPEDFSTGELRSMKYASRRASIEVKVNGDKPSKVVTNGSTAFYSDYDAYAAFMSDNLNN